MTSAPSSRSRLSALCIGGTAVDHKLLALGPLQLGTSNPTRAHQSPGGVARNVAENLCRLGLQVDLVCAVGQDSAGEALLADARAAGIGTAGAFRLPGVQTDSYTAVLDDAGELLVAMVDMSATEHLTPQRLGAAHPAHAASLRVLDLNLPTDTLAMHLRAASTGMLAMVAVSVDKVHRLPPDLQRLDLLVLNRDELQALCGTALPRLRDLRRAMAQVMQRGVRHLVVTLGRQGVLFATRQPRPLAVANPAWSTHVMGHVRGPRVRAVDVTGAGDSFAAAVCWSLLHEPRQLRLACQRGLRLAALTLQTAASVYPQLQPDTLLHH